MKQKERKRKEKKDPSCDGLSTFVDEAHVRQQPSFINNVWKSSKTYIM